MLIVVGWRAFEMATVSDRKWTPQLIVVSSLFYSIFQLAQAAALTCNCKLNALMDDTISMKVGINILSLPNSNPKISLLKAKAREVFAAKVKIPGFFM